MKTELRKSIAVRRQTGFPARKKTAKSIVDDDDDDDDDDAGKERNLVSKSEPKKITLNDVVSRMTYEYDDDDEDKDEDEALTVR